MNNKEEFNKKLLKKYIDENNLSHQYPELVKRLESGEPLQYVIGNVNFYGYPFLVDKRVLIPRFCTEELVNYTLKFIDKNFKDNFCNVLDIGTGSGCISITLKKENPNLMIDACDISVDALKVAKANAIINKCEINFIESDIFSKINKHYDVIISNPPYISYDEEIEDIVRDNEPDLALYASDNGLYFYEEILKNVNKYLNDKYLIAFEIGYQQAESIKKIANKYLKDISVEVINDMECKNRFIFITNI